MKRILIMILCLMFLCGCSAAGRNIREPVSVYYRAAQVSYHSADGVICAEKREFYNRRTALRKFMNEYLAGPTSQKLDSPFPSGASILELTETETSIKVMLNLPFLQMAPNELSLAYACISMTLFEVTDVQSVDLYIWGTDYEIDHTVMYRDHLHLADTTFAE